MKSQYHFNSLVSIFRRRVHNIHFLTRFLHFLMHKSASSVYLLPNCHDFSPKRGPRRGSGLPRSSGSAAPGIRRRETPQEHTVRSAQRSPDTAGQPPNRRKTKKPDGPSRSERRIRSRPAFTLFHMTDRRSLCTLPAREETQILRASTSVQAARKPSKRSSSIARRMSSIRRL